MPAIDSLQISYREDTLPSVAAQLWQWANSLPNAADTRRVWAFSGYLGAGKTTLIRALCSQLGVEDAVHSPTFSLINEYASPHGPVLHMDWYRLSGEDEALNAGMEDALLQPEAVCFVEWPERAAGLLLMPHLWVEIDAVGEAERVLRAKPQP